MSGEIDPGEVFRAITVALVSGDFDTAAGLLAEDIVMDWSRSRGMQQGLRKGRESVRAFWEDLYEAWKPIAWDIDVVARPDPETVVVESKPRARGRGSGIELQGRGGLIVRVRDGKLLAITLFQSPEEALAATAGS